MNKQRSRNTSLQRDLLSLHQLFENLFHRNLSFEDPSFQTIFLYYNHPSNKVRPEQIRLLQQHLPYTTIRTKHQNISSINHNSSSAPSSRRSSLAQPPIYRNNIVSLRKKYIYYHHPETQTSFQLPIAFQEIIAFPGISEPIREFLLLLVGILRLYYVDKLIDTITHYFYSCKTNLPGFDMKCNVVAVGSTALTSNYDVTVSGIIFPQRIVQKFNQIFVDFWGDYSSIVFDTNLYGSTFFVTTPSSYQVPPHVPLLFNETMTHPRPGSFGDPVRGVNTQKVYYLPPKYTPSNAAFIYRIRQEQFHWLPVKLLFHSHEYHFYGTPLYNTYQSRLTEIIQSLLGSPQEIEVDTILEEKDLQDPENLVGDENLPQKVRFYEETQLEVRLALEKYELIGINLVAKASPLFQESQPPSPESEAMADALCELIETISRNNYYGMETYYCMGTIYHILGFIQGLAPFEMQPYYFQISALENFIDLFRYAHYFQDPSKFEKAVIKMSKYAYRVYDALSQLSSPPADHPRKASWKAILDRFKGKSSLNSSNRNTLLRSVLNNRSMSTSTSTSIEMILEEIWLDIHRVLFKTNNVNL